MRSIPFRRPHTTDRNRRAGIKHQREADGAHARSRSTWCKILTSNIAPSLSSKRSNWPPRRISHVNSHNVIENAQPFTPPDGQLYYDAESQPLPHHAYSESNPSRVVGSNTTPSSGADGEISRTIDGLALNTSNGNPSPQLPLPASGASSTSARNPPCEYRVQGDGSMI